MCNGKPIGPDYEGDVAICVATKPDVETARQLLAVSIGQFPKARAFYVCAAGEIVAGSVRPG